MMSDTAWANLLLGLFAALVIAANVWNAHRIDRKHEAGGR